MKFALSNFIRIGGRHIYAPPLYAVLQTDGSYKHREGAVAAILTTANGSIIYRDMKKAVVMNSTEAEWASVANGIQLALEKEQFAIAVENDNLGVIAGLTGHSKLKHPYARFYRSEIEKLTSHTLWTGVRWIPREKNRADDLFLR